MWAHCIKDNLYSSVLTHCYPHHLDICISLIYHYPKYGPVTTRSVIVYFCLSFYYLSGSLIDNFDYFEKLNPIQNHPFIYSVTSS